MTKELKLIECPRDAMQGWKTQIPTEVKVNYINHLLTLGFDTIDFGSFVSPKAIPQMADTKEVLAQLDLAKTNSKLLAIIANQRGADDALQHEEISYLGFPFSVSEEFQQRNTNSSIEESLGRVADIQNMCLKKGKDLVVYLSMGFGNPYGESWHPDLVTTWSERLYKEFDIKIIAPSDTIGCATPEISGSLFGQLIKELPQIEFGAHLHTLPENATKLIEATYNSGCRRFDGAIKGFGGCPMAKDDLTGNMPTERMIGYFEDQNIPHGIDLIGLREAEKMSMKIFA